MPCEERVAFCWILAPTVYDLDGQNARVTLATGVRTIFAQSARRGQMYRAHGVERGKRPHEPPPTPWAGPYDLPSLRSAACLCKNHTRTLWLREAGFSEVTALHVVGGCVLIAAVKR